MTFFKSIIWLLVLSCLRCSTPCFGQQLPRPDSLAASRALLTSADTVAALQDMFRAKRKSSGWFLAAAPVVVGLSVVGMAVGILSGSDDAIVPIMGVSGGIVGTVALLTRYNRYTKASEREVLREHERRRELPGWVWRNLAEHRAAKP